MRYLRTNTATRITVGPFLDETDGVTPQTTLTVTNEKLTLVVDDGGVPTLILDTAPTASGGANDMVHITGDDAGFYDLELAAADVNYLGRAMLSLTDASTHCPVFHELMILPANIYDSMILGTDLVDVSVTQFAGSAITSASGIPEVKVQSVANDAITANAIATDAIGSAELSSGAAQEIADALLDRTDGVETSITLRSALKLMLAALAGKISGAETTSVTIRNVGDTKNRIVATVDADGNRSAVTTDVS